MLDVLKIIRFTVLYSLQYVTAVMVLMAVKPLHGD